MENKSYNKIKKASSHIEIVLSFVIFIGFVIFILAILNPFNILNKSSLDITAEERKIQDSLSTSLEFITIKINPQSTVECYCFDSSDFGFKKIKVKNPEGISVDSIIYNGNSCFNPGEEKFLYVYSSEEFAPESWEASKCTTLSYPGEYRLGILRTLSAVSETKINEFKSKYENNYEKLKEELKINNDFSMTISSSGNEPIIFSRELPLKTEIVAKDFSIKIINSEGKINYGILNLKIW